MGTGVHEWRQYASCAVTGPLRARHHRLSRSGRWSSRSRLGPRWTGRDRTDWGARGRESADNCTEHGPPTQDNRHRRRWRVEVLCVISRW